MSNEKINFSTEEGQSKFTKLSEEGKKEIIGKSQQEAEMIDDYLSRSDYSKEYSLAKLEELKARLTGDETELRKRQEKMKKLVNNAGEWSTKQMLGWFEFLQKAIEGGSNIGKEIDMDYSGFKLLATLLDKDLINFDNNKLKGELIKIGKISGSVTLVLMATKNEEGIRTISLCRFFEKDFEGLNKKNNEKA